MRAGWDKAEALGGGDFIRDAKISIRGRASQSRGGWKTARPFAVGGVDFAKMGLTFAYGRAKYGILRIGFMSEGGSTVAAGEDKF